MALPASSSEDRDPEAQLAVPRASNDVTGYARLRRAWISHPLLYLFCLAFAVRAAVAVVVSDAFSGSFVLDDQTYWGIARDMANGSTSTWDAYTRGVYTQTKAFSIPLSLVYNLSGGNELAGQMMVAAIGSALVVMVFLIARRVLGNTSLALVPALTVALLPSQILWSSLILKDSFVWVALASIAYAFIRLTQEKVVRQIFIWVSLIGLALFLLGFLRPHTTVVAAWALLLASWVSSPPYRWLRMISVAWVAVLIPWFIGLGLLGVPFALNANSVTAIRDANALGADSAIVTPPAEIARRLTTRQTELQRQLEEAEAERAEASAAEGGAARVERASARADELRAELNRVAALLARESHPEVGTEPGSAATTDPTREVGIRYIARGVSVMLFEPYPWDPSTSPSFTMAKFEAIVWYPVLILGAVGVVAALRRWRLMLLPSLLGLGTMILYALTEGNVGTAFRHRGEFAWVISLFAGFGFAALRQRRKARTTPS